MRFSNFAAVLLHAATALAQTTKNCPSGGGGICYQVVVPSKTSSAGNGDIFFQISGPSTMQWIGLGEGNQMAGANIFVIYAAADGKNVTLSPRSGQGHKQPEANQQAQVSLLDGSGISNGVMTANVRCSNCESWNGGTLDVKSSSSNWIWAAKSGDALKSDSASAEIEEHSSNGNLNFDLSKATGGDSLNPFVAAATTPTANAPTSSGTSSSSSTNSSPAQTDTSSADSSSGGSSDNVDKIAKAHGWVMALVFLILFPLGAIVMRLFSFGGLVWVHAGIQLLTFTLAIVGLGLGAWVADHTSQLNQAHPIIGLTVIALLFFQPILGLIHHRVYVKRRYPTLWGRTHVWYGRALLLLAVINGGLGLKLSDNTKSGEIAYGVIAGLVFLLYLAVFLFTTVKPRAGRTVDGVAPPGTYSSEAIKMDNRN